MNKATYLLGGALLAAAAVTASPSAAQQNYRNIIFDCAIAAGYDGPFRIESGVNQNGQYVRLGASEGLDRGTRALANSCAAGQGVPVNGTAAATGGTTVVFGDGGRRTIFRGGRRATVEIEAAPVRASGQPTAATAVEAGEGAAVPARLFCPYPYRASDTVFANGSGYVLKDTVRQSLGCR